MYALVAVEKIAYSFDRLFVYNIPAAMNAQAGFRVLVPFGAGNQKPRVGVVFRICDELAENPRKLKNIISLLDDAPLFGEETLAIAAYIRDQYFCTWYDALRCQMPVGLAHRVRREYIAAPDPPETLYLGVQREIVEYLRKRGGYVREDMLWKNLGFAPDQDTLQDLVDKGLVLESAAALREIGDASEKTARIIGEVGSIKLTKKQREILELLEDFGSLTLHELCSYTGYTPAVTLALEKKGLIELYETTRYRLPKEDALQHEEGAVELTREQKRVCRSLWRQLNNHEEKRFALLHGVTGSGKTQVYLALAEAALKKGQSVLLLVPEIALTLSLLAQVKARFGDCAAILHSALSAGERADAWRRAWAGDVKLCIGTRSAVFTPLQNLGLIVMDEEQEESYKSGITPRYDAREIAKFRAKRHNALLLLGSATPSVESYAAAVKGHYSLQTLPQRYGNAVLPSVQIVDMGIYGNKPLLISEPLREAIGETLMRGEQIVLLLNRRGYNTFAVCRKCRTTLECPQCSISLTYHFAENRLMCHFCGYSRSFSRYCPACKNDGAEYYGFGTQRGEDVIAQLFPEARVLRMDADAAARKGSHGQILEAFRNREADILLGTQMVAKGLDFENVTLVGVLNVDSQLRDDDYRSLERTFALITQVVGRAGRGEKRGRAILQTVTPEERTITLAARQDYIAFFNTEIALRKLLVYPPFCTLFVVTFSCGKRVLAESAARFALDYLKEHAEMKLIILGPMPERIMKAAGKYRYRLILKAQNTPQIRAVLSEFLASFGRNKEFLDVSVGVGRG
ncbi:MAG: primosomal protein N' [Oscillospiraceae bacterium]|nr:primosomal protein N' [Oscillospiraceae bacterium]